MSFSINPKTYVFADLMTVAANGRVSLTQVVKDLIEELYHYRFVQCKEYLDYILYDKLKEFNAQKLQQLVAAIQTFWENKRRGRYIDKSRQPVCRPLRDYIDAFFDRFHSLHVDKKNEHPEFQELCVIFFNRVPDTVRNAFFKYSMTVKQDYYDRCRKYVRFSYKEKLDHQKKKQEQEKRPFAFDIERGEGSNNFFGSDAADWDMIKLKDSKGKSHLFDMFHHGGYFTPKEVSHQLKAEGRENREADYQTDEESLKVCETFLKNHLLVSIELFTNNQPTQQMVSPLALANMEDAGMLPRYPQNWQPSEEVKKLIKDFKK